jgi:protease I
VLIGGRGALNAAGNAAVLRTVQKFHKSGKIIAAICLAPVILARAGILSGKEAACHQSGMKELSAAGCVVVSREVVRSGNIITASGPEAAASFANFLLQIV